MQSSQYLLSYVMLSFISYWNFIPTRWSPLPIDIAVLIEQNAPQSSAHNGICTKSTDIYIHSSWHYYISQSIRPVMPVDTNPAWLSISHIQLILSQYILIWDVSRPDSSLIMLSFHYFQYDILMGTLFYLEYCTISSKVKASGRLPISTAGY